MILSLKPKRLRYWLRVAACIIVLIAMFFPIYWLLISSIKSINSVVTGNVFLPPIHPDFTYYIRVATSSDFWGFFLNSIVIGISATILTIILSALGAYSLARYKFFGSEFIGSSILFIYMIPKVLLAVPLYIWMFDLGLLDTRMAVVLAYVAEGIPFSLWMMRGFFVTLPRELEESSLVDGCTRIGSLVRIMLPLAAPGIVAAAMYTLINAWNDFLFAFMLIDSPSKTTIPVGLRILFQSSGSQELRLAALMAASVIVTIPVLLLFFFVQRTMVKGLASGAVKG